jgi:MinD-like ATPase involved in chromosome partitioning or flagellar assembly
VSRWRRKSDEDEQDADAVARWDAFQSMLGDAQQPKSDEVGSEPNGTPAVLPQQQVSNGGWLPPGAVPEPAWHNPPAGPAPSVPESLATDAPWGSASVVLPADGVRATLSRSDDTVSDVDSSDQQPGAVAEQADSAESEAAAAAEPQAWPAASVAEPNYGWSPPQRPVAWSPPAPPPEAASGQPAAPGPWIASQPSAPWLQAGHPQPGSVQQPPAPFPPQQASPQHQPAPPQQQVPQQPYPYAQQPYPPQPPPHQQQWQAAPQQPAPPAQSTEVQPGRSSPPARPVEEAPPRPPETPPFVWTDAYQTGQRGIPAVQSGPPTQPPPIQPPPPQSRPPRQSPQSRPAPTPPQPAPFGPWDAGAQQSGPPTGPQAAAQRRPGAPTTPAQAGPPQWAASEQVPAEQLPTPFQLAGPSSVPGQPGGTDELSAEALIGRRSRSSRGLRKAVSTISVRPGHARAEQRRRELIAQATVPVHGCYRIAVISLKGGVGKTISTVCIGATLASLRGDRVIAVDANPDRGTLSGKIPLQTTATVRNLLNDAEQIQSYSDVRRYTSQSPDRLEVLASESDPSVSLAFGEEDYRRVARVLERFYNVVLTDCGTGLLHSAMAGVLALADQIVVVSSGSVDGARSASATLDWLDAHGYSELVANSLAVINSVRPKSGGVNIDALESHFAARCRSVTRIPYDAHLELGAEVDLAELSQSSRDALLELAAHVAAGFPLQALPPGMGQPQQPYGMPLQQGWPGPAGPQYPAS